MNTSNKELKSVEKKEKSISFQVINNNRKKKKRVIKKRKTRSERRFVFFFKNYPFGSFRIFSVCVILLVIAASFSFILCYSLFNFL